MMKFNKDTASFESISKSNLKAENILERSDLQRAIVSSWDIFKNELGLPNAFLIGQEITPDQTTQNSLDLLAYDSDDSSLVVIELKRDRNKLQLLQAISYAAMISKWSIETVIEHISRQHLADHEELTQMVEDNGLSSEIKIILVAESYDPEVIVSADWLSGYDLKISAFVINLHNHQGDSLVSVEQRYPLLSLEDAYDLRNVNRRTNTAKKSVAWPDVISRCQYEFAGRAIQMCRKLKDGDPARKRFVHIAPGFSSFDNLDFYFRNKYVVVYLFGVYEEKLSALLEGFEGEVKVGSWQGGYSLTIDNETQFKELIALDERFDY